MKHDNPYLLTFLDKDLEMIVDDPEAFLEIVRPVYQFAFGKKEIKYPSNIFARAIVERMCEAHRKRIAEAADKSEKMRRNAGERWKSKKSEDYANECNCIQDDAIAYIPIPKTKTKPIPRASNNARAREEWPSFESLMETAKSFDPPLPEEFVRYFHESMETDGWKDGKGHDILNVPSAMRKWFERWNQSKDRFNQPQGVVLNEEYDLSKFGE